MNCYSIWSMVYVLVKNNLGVMGAVGPHPDHCNGPVHTPVLEQWLLPASDTLTGAIIVQHSVVTTPALDPVFHQMAAP